MSLLEQLQKKLAERQSLKQDIEQQKTDLDCVVSFNKIVLSKQTIKND